MPSVHDFLARWDIALRLPLPFDRSRLADDLSRMDASWWRPHRGPYHDGNWEMIALHAPGGDLHNQTSRGAPFAATEAARRCTYLREVLAAFPAELNRVRYMRLRAGGRILPHSDPMQDIDPRLIRIHIPVATSQAVDFRVNGTRVDMHEGEAWFVDVRFRHEVTNGGNSDRVHLVVDMLRNDRIDQIARDSESAGNGRLFLYFLKHALPSRVKRWAGLGN